MKERKIELQGVAVRKITNDKKFQWDGGGECCRVLRERYLGAKVKGVSEDSGIGINNPLM